MLHPVKVERLPVNYKTAEDFERFALNGNNELSMQNEFQISLIESDQDTLFYGIYEGTHLAARMALTFLPALNNTIEITKLEVLPAYQGNGLGLTLVNFVKDFGKPIKTKARIHSEGFWDKAAFQDSGDKENSLTVMGWSPSEQNQKAVH